MSETPHVSDRKPHVHQFSTLGLADIARVAGYSSVSSEPEVGFRIVHGGATPSCLSALSPLLDGADEDTSGASDLAGLMAFEANGAFAMISTFHGRSGATDSIGHMGAADDRGWRDVTAFGSPQPRFLYERRELLEGIIGIQSDSRFPDTRFTRAMGMAAREVAAIARDFDNPLLMIHAPNEIPPNRKSYKNTIHERDPLNARSTSVAVRFAVALGDAKSSTKMRFVERLSEYAAPLGLTLWLGDTRPGYRSGNWYNVVPNSDQDRAAYLGSLTDGVELISSPNSPNYMLPVTLFGPARVGSSAAILDRLTGVGSNGAYAVSITSLNDLAFIHLQLPVPLRGRARSELTEIMRDLFPRQNDVYTTAEAIPRILDLTSRSGRTGTGIPALGTLGPARDYEMVVGPLSLVTHRAAKYIPVWVSWHVAGRSPSLRSVLDALVQSLDELDLLGEMDRGTVLQYAVGRDKGDAGRRGRAKFSVHPHHLERWNESEYGSASAAMCQDIEVHWRRRVRLLKGSGQVSVGDREYRVGYGSGGV